MTTLIPDSLDPLPCKAISRRTSCPSPLPSLPWRCCLLLCKAHHDTPTFRDPPRTFPSHLQEDSQIAVLACKGPAIWPWPSHLTSFRPLCCLAITQLYSFIRRWHSDYCLRLLHLWFPLPSAFFLHANEFFQFQLNIIVRSSNLMV